MNPNQNTAVQEDDGTQALLEDFKSLESELAKEKDLHVRLAADFDNFRKRAVQEADRRAAAQKEAFIRELLPIIDNLERAVSSSSSASPEQLRQGVQMTLQQLYQLLRRHGIEPEASDGQPFDPTGTRRSPPATIRPSPTKPCWKPPRRVTAGAPKSSVQPKSSSMI